MMCCSQSRPLPAAILYDTVGRNCNIKWLVVGLGYFRLMMCLTIDMYLRSNPRNHV